MTKEQIELMVKFWQEKLRLQNWVIKVRWDVHPSHEDTIAQVNKIDGRYYASVRFCKDILDYEDQNEVSMYVCHELIHLHLNAIWNTVEILLKNQIGNVISNDFADNINILMCRDIEHATDALATAFAEALPYKTTITIDNTANAEAFNNISKNYVLKAFQKAATGGIVPANNQAIVVD